MPKKQPPLLRLLDKLALDAMRKDGYWKRYL